MQHSDKLFLDSFTKMYMKEINNPTNAERNEQFFLLKNQLFHEMSSFQLDEAKVSLRQIIDIIIEKTGENHGENMIVHVKNFYIQLVAFMANRLYENKVPSDKVLAFNNTCVEVIETKMNDAQFMQCGYELVEFFVKIVTERKTPNFGHQTVNKVIMHINDQMETELTVEQIAKRFNISTSHLSRIFREHTGVTLVEYLNVRKVEECQYFLRHTNKGISDISDAYHFCNQSYFTRIFKKYSGITPKQFRDNQDYPTFKYSFPNNNL